MTDEQFNPDRANYLCQRIDAALSAIEAEKDNSSTHPSRLAPSVEQLEYVHKALSNLKKNIEANRIPPRQKRYPELSRHITDCWPLGTEIGNQVSEIETLFRSM